MGSDADIGSGEDYLDIPVFVRIIIQSFGISLGDILINQYGWKVWGDQ